MSADLSDATLVAQRLDEAFQSAQDFEQTEGKYVLDISNARLVLFSDHHKGNRDGADDFRGCERAYNAALAYYYRHGHTLVLLGDIEELWEERPLTVFRAYNHTLGLERKFFQDGRYIRVWGNHDDEWSYPDRVDQLLTPVLGGGTLKVRESLILHVRDGSEEIGRILLVHGHQGTLESDKYSYISRFIVRYIWRPIQRVIKFSFNTPAKDFQLRQKHDAALYYWSENQDKIVLIAGHTHRPVFKSEAHETSIRKALETAEIKLGEDPNNQELIQTVAERSAELEWVVAQNRDAPGVPSVINQKKPSYFNTGCCAFFDGDITGIEIRDGEIRLVRWPDEERNPKPTFILRAKLEDVFGSC